MRLRSSVQTMLSDESFSRGSHRCSHRLSSHARSMDSPTASKSFQRHLQLCCATATELARVAPPLNTESAINALQQTGTSPHLRQNRWALPYLPQQARDHQL